MEILGCEKAAEVMVILRPWKLRPFNSHAEFLPPVDQMLVLDRQPKRIS
jgi:hypothetical protein